MDIKNKIKSYSFWVSISSALILILKVLSQRFNFNIDENMISDIFTALCSVLVILGFFLVPTASKEDSLIDNEVSIVSQIKNDILNKTGELEKRLFKDTTKSEQKQTQENNSSTEKILNNTTEEENLEISDEIDTLQNCKQSSISGEQPSNEELENFDDTLFYSNEESNENTVEEIEIAENDSKSQIEDNIDIQENIISQEKSQVTNSNNAEFEKILKSQKCIYQDNIEEFINILKREISDLENQ